MRSVKSILRQSFSEEDVLLYKKFYLQRRGATKRGLLWNLTFEDWLLLWKESGKISERGNHSEQYVMARFGDEGGYELGNVKIVTNRQNLQEARLKEKELGATTKKQKVKVMSRKRKTEAYVQQKVNFNALLMARFARIHFDSTHQKVKYGAVSQVLNSLLADYVNKVETGAAEPQRILSDAELSNAESLQTNRL